MPALLDPSKDPKAAMADAANAWRGPIGAASPLWLMFAGVASAGVAYWWLNRWRAEAVNLEAALPLPMAAPVLPVAELPAPEPAIAPVIEAAAEVVETVEAAVEAPVEAAIEVLAEVAPEPVIEAAPEPVAEPGIEPVVEAAGPPATKPRAAPKAKSAPKGDLA